MTKGHLIFTTAYNYRNKRMFLLVVLIVSLAGFACLSLFRYSSVKSRETKIMELTVKSRGGDETPGSVPFETYGFIDSDPDSGRTTVAVIEEKLKKLEVLSNALEIRPLRKEQSGNLVVESAKIIIDGVTSKKIAPILDDFENSYPYLRIIACEVSESGERTFRLSLTVQRWFRSS